MSLDQFAQGIGSLKWDYYPPKSYKDILEQPEHFKIVVVGDGAVGKTCMLLTFAMKQFPGEYIPTQMDFSFGTLEGIPYSISLWDTAGREDYDRLRPLSYTNARVCFICFSVISIESLNNVSRIYVPELTHFLPGIPIMLIGCKIDLRDDKETISRLREKGLKGAITKEEGEAVAKNLKLAKYMECSALKQIGLNEIFATAVHVAAGPPKAKKEKKGRCTLL